MIILILTSNCVTPHKAEKMCFESGHPRNSSNFYACARDAVYSEKYKLNYEMMRVEAYCNELSQSSKTLDYNQCLASNHPNKFERMKNEGFVECKKPLVNKCLSALNEGFSNRDKYEELRNLSDKEARAAHLREAKLCRSLESALVKDFVGQVKTCMKTVKIDIKMIRSQEIIAKRRKQKRREAEWDRVINSLKSTNNAGSESKFNVYNSGCSSDYDCSYGEKCVKDQYESHGYCAQKVNKYGAPTFTLPDPESIGVRFDSSCDSSLDCPVGFRCESNSCVK
jgi:hypothetical protein